MFFFSGKTRKINIPLKNDEKNIRGIKMVGATKFTVCLIKRAIYRNSRCRYFDKGYCTLFCLIAFVKSLAIFIRFWRLYCEKAYIDFKANFSIIFT